MKLNSANGVHVDMAHTTFGKCPQKYPTSFFSPFLLIGGFNGYCSIRPCRKESYPVVGRCGILEGTWVCRNFVELPT